MKSEIMKRRRRREIPLPVEISEDEASTSAQQQQQHSDTNDNSDDDHQEKVAKQQHNKMKNSAREDGSEEEQHSSGSGSEEEPRKPKQRKQLLKKNKRGKQVEPAPSSFFRPQVRPVQMTKRKQQQQQQQQSKSKKSRFQVFEEDEDEDDVESSDDDDNNDLDSDDLLSPSDMDSDDNGKGDESSSSDSDGDDESDVIGEFEHFDPAESDFHTLKRFLTDFLDGDEYDVSGLADLVLEQGKTIGTVQKVLGEGDAVGFISIINVQKHKDKECIKQVIKFLKKHCPAEKKGELEEILGEDTTTGLILSERLFNMPDALALPLTMALFDEMDWAVEDEPEESRDSYKFDNFLLLTRAVKASAAALAQPTPFMATSKAGKKKKKEEQLSLAGEQLIFIKPEEEAYYKKSKFSFDFASKNPSEDGMSQRMLVMSAPVASKTTILELVKKIVGTAAIEQPENDEEEQPEQ